MNGRSEPEPRASSLCAWVYSLCRFHPRWFPSFRKQKHEHWNTGSYVMWKFSAFWGRHTSHYDKPQWHCPDSESHWRKWGETLRSSPQLYQVQLTSQTQQSQALHWAQNTPFELDRCYCRGGGEEHTAQAVIIGSTTAWTWTRLLALPLISLPTLSPCFLIYKMEVRAHSYSIALLCAQHTVDIQQILSPHPRPRLEKRGGRNVLWDLGTHRVMKN